MDLQCLSRYFFGNSTPTAKTERAMVTRMTSRVISLVMWPPGGRDVSPPQSAGLKRFSATGPVKEGWQWVGRHERWQMRDAPCTVRQEELTDDDTKHGGDDCFTEVEPFLDKERQHTKLSPRAIPRVERASAQPYPPSQARSQPGPPTARATRSSTHDDDKESQADIYQMSRRNLERVEPVRRYV